MNEIQELESAMALLAVPHGIFVDLFMGVVLAVLLAELFTRLQRRRSHRNPGYRFGFNTKLAKKGGARLVLQWGQPAGSPDFISGMR
jgi:hypothetical protein